jgi:hypothetical protein
MRKIVTCLLFIVSTGVLFSHPGRTDSNGGHNGSNGYHTHGGRGNEVYPIPIPQRTTPSNQSEKDLFLAYYENNSITFFSGEYNLHTYDAIENNSRKIIMYFYFNNEQAAINNGAAIGTECVNIMLDWLKERNLSVPNSRGSLYCFILNQSRQKEYWLAILDEKTKEIVTEKRY